MGKAQSDQAQALLRAPAPAGLQMRCIFLRLVLRDPSSVRHSVLTMSSHRFSGIGATTDAVRARLQPQVSGVPAGAVVLSCCAPSPRSRPFGLQSLTPSRLRRCALRLPPGERPAGYLRRAALGAPGQPAPSASQKARRPEACTASPSGASRGQSQPCLLRGSATRRPRASRPGRGSFAKCCTRPLRLSCCAQPSSPGPSASPRAAASGRQRSAGHRVPPIARPPPALPPRGTQVKTNSPGLTARISRKWSLR